jgi:hypothetical protein
VGAEIVYQEGFSKEQKPVVTISRAGERALETCGKEDNHHEETHDLLKEEERNRALREKGEEEGRRGREGEGGEEGRREKRKLTTT